MTRYLIMFSLIAMLLPVGVSAQQATQKWVESTPAVRGFPGPLATTTTIARQRYSGNQEIRKAMKAIKDAESEADKDKAKDELKSLLEAQYDESLDRYEEYLAEMEKKITELRKQLDRRRDAKMEMVDLRLQVLISDAEGLGWPEQYFSVPGGTLSPFYQMTPGQSGFAPALPVVPPTAETAPAPTRPKRTAR